MKKPRTVIGAGFSFRGGNRYWIHSGVAVVPDEP